MSTVKAAKPKPKEVKDDKEAKAKEAIKNSQINVYVYKMDNVFHDVYYAKIRKYDYNTPYFPIDIKEISLPVAITGGIRTKIPNPPFFSSALKSYKHNIYNFETAEKCYENIKKMSDAIKDITIDDGDQVKKKYVNNIVSRIIDTFKLFKQNKENKKKFPDDKKDTEIESLEKMIKEYIKEIYDNKKTYIYDENKKNIEEIIAQTGGGNYIFTEVEECYMYYRQTDNYIEIIWDYKPKTEFKIQNETQVGNIEVIEGVLRLPLKDKIDDAKVVAQQFAEQYPKFSSESSEENGPDVYYKMESTNNVYYFIYENTVYEYGIVNEKLYFKRHIQFTSDYIKQIKQNTKFVNVKYLTTDTYKMSKFPIKRYSEEVLIQSKLKSIHIENINTPDKIKPSSKRKCPYGDACLYGMLGTCVNDHNPTCPLMSLCPIKPICTNAHYFTTVSNYKHKFVSYIKKEFEGEVIVKYDQYKYGLTENPVAMPFDPVTNMFDELIIPPEIYTIIQNIYMELFNKSEILRKYNDIIAMVLYNVFKQFQTGLVMGGLNELYNQLVNKDDKLLFIYMYKLLIFNVYKSEQNLFNLYCNLESLVKDRVTDTSDGIFYIKHWLEDEEFTGKLTDAQKKILEVLKSFYSNQKELIKNESDLSQILLNQQIEEITSHYNTDYLHKQQFIQQIYSRLLEQVFKFFDIIYELNKLSEYDKDMIEYILKTVKSIIKTGILLHVEQYTANTYIKTYGSELINLIDTITYNHETRKIEVDDRHIKEKIKQLYRSPIDRSVETTPDEVRSVLMDETSTDNTYKAFFMYLYKLIDELKSTIKQCTLNSFIFVNVKKLIAYKFIIGGNKRLYNDIIKKIEYISNEIYIKGAVQDFINKLKKYAIILNAIIFLMCNDSYKLLTLCFSLAIVAGATDVDVSQIMTDIKAHKKEYIYDKPVPPIKVSAEIYDAKEQVVVELIGTDVRDSYVIEDVGEGEEEAEKADKADELNRFGETIYDYCSDEFKKKLSEAGKKDGLYDKLLEIHKTEKYFKEIKEKAAEIKKIDEELKKVDESIAKIEFKNKDEGLEALAKYKKLMDENEAAMTIYNDRIIETLDSSKKLEFEKKMDGLKIELKTAISKTTRLNINTYDTKPIIDKVRFDDYVEQSAAISNYIDQYIKFLKNERMYNIIDEGIKHDEQLIAPKNDEQKKLTESKPKKLKEYDDLVSELKTIHKEPLLKLDDKSSVKEIVDTYKSSVEKMIGYNNILIWINFVKKILQKIQDDDMIKIFGEDSAKIIKYGGKTFGDNMKDIIDIIKIIITTKTNLKPAVEFRLKEVKEMYDLQAKITKFIEDKKKIYEINKDIGDLDKKIEDKNTELKGSQDEIRIGNAIDGEITALLNQDKPEKTHIENNLIAYQSDIAKAIQNEAQSQERFIINYVQLAKQKNIGNPIEIIREVENSVDKRLTRLNTAKLTIGLATIDYARIETAIRVCDDIKEIIKKTDKKAAQILKTAIEKTVDLEIKSIKSEIPAADKSGLRKTNILNAIQKKIKETQNPTDILKEMDNLEKEKLKTNVDLTQFTSDTFATLKKRVGDVLKAEADKTADEILNAIKNTVARIIEESVSTAKDVDDQTVKDFKKRLQDREEKIQVLEKRLKSSQKLLTAAEETKKKIEKELQDLKKQLSDKKKEIDKLQKMVDDLKNFLTNHPGPQQIDYGTVLDQINTYDSFDLSQLVALALKHSKLEETVRKFIEIMNEIIEMYKKQDTFKNVSVDESSRMYIYDETKTLEKFARQCEVIYQKQIDSVSAYNHVAFKKFHEIKFVPILKVINDDIKDEINEINQNVDKLIANINSIVDNLSKPLALALAPAPAPVTAAPITDLDQIIFMNIEVLYIINYITALSAVISNDVTRETSKKLRDLLKDIKNKLFGSSGLIESMKSKLKLHFEFDKDDLVNDLLKDIDKIKINNFDKIAQLIKLTKDPDLPDKEDLIKAMKKAIKDLIFEKEKEFIDQMEREQALIADKIKTKDLENTPPVYCLYEVYADFIETTVKKITRTKTDTKMDILAIQRDINAQKENLTVLHAKLAMTTYGMPDITKFATPTPPINLFLDKIYKSDGNNYMPIYLDLPSFTPFLEKHKNLLEKYSELNRLYIDRNVVKKINIEERDRIDEQIRKMLTEYDTNFIIGRPESFDDSFKESTTDIPDISAIEARFNLLQPYKSIYLMIIKTAVKTIYSFMPDRLLANYS